MTCSAIEGFATAAFVFAIFAGIAVVRIAGGYRDWLERRKP